MGAVARLVRAASSGPHRPTFLTSMHAEEQLLPPDATVTGLATPSIDATLVNRLGVKPSVKRTPIFGLGSVAGAAGTARAVDYLRAYPGEVAVLLSVELCSLTLQREDLRTNVSAAQATRNPA